ncbi:MAG TPA: hypothetical protein VMZ25_11110 [Terriglobales bacterium]|nr:hypothetical protein [Terriglobales bacterium]
MQEALHNAGKRNAVRNNTGQSVHQSDPGLRRPTFPATAGRKPEACPPLQPKTGREREGRALAISGGEADAPFFNEIQTNRNYKNRNRNCGRWTTAGTSNSTGRVSFHRLNCKCWGCGYCGRRKAKRYRFAIGETAERLKLNKFLTLTLDPKKITGDPVRYLNKTFAVFRVYLQKSGYRITYIRVLEFQKNGTPHLHILMNQGMPFQWIQETWQQCGGGLFVNIKQVDVHRISHYLSKYLTKELLLSTPKGTRRVTTSRNIQMFSKTDTGQTWKLLKTNIGFLYERIRDHVLEAEADEENYLCFFSIPFGIDPVPG